MPDQTAEGSTLFVCLPGTEHRFAKGWRWAVPVAMRQCIGQIWTWRGRGADRRKVWVDTGAYDFHRGCLIYNRASGSTMALDVAGQTTTYAVQVEDASPRTERSPGHVVYRWYQHNGGALSRIEADLQSCSQAEFVRRLREGMKPPTLALALGLSAAEGLDVVPVEEVECV